jgi:hypothetical protein
MEYFTVDKEMKGNPGNDRFDGLIKKIIKRSPFFRKMFKAYDVDMDLMDEGLTFYVSDLGTKNAKANGKEIHINQKVIKENPKLEDVIHYIVHEMTHWLIRNREEDHYLFDPEEIDAFTLGMAYEIYRGTNQDKILKIYLPIFNKHFDDNYNAVKFFRKLYEKAKNLVKKRFDT